MLNLTNKTPLHYFDEFGMLVVKGDERSWRDSVGRTILAWIAYGKPIELERGLDVCLKNKFSEKKASLYRHPSHKEKASRDHWSYFIIYIKLGYPGWLSGLMKYAPRMRGLNSWMKALTGNKRAEWWYYTLAIPGARIGNGFLWFCRWAGGISKELDNEAWIGGNRYAFAVGPWYVAVKYVNWWIRIWAWIIFTSMPAYALHNKAWQIYVMPASHKKEKLKRILLKRVGKSNLMLRLLFDAPETKEYVFIQDVDNYPHMTGYRPGVYLDETCRRDIRELTDKEASVNCYEKDLIVWLYNQKQL